MAQMANYNYFSAILKRLNAFHSNLYWIIVSYAYVHVLKLDNKLRNSPKLEHYQKSSEPQLNRFENNFTTYIKHILRYYVTAFGLRIIGGHFERFWNRKW